MGSLRARTLVLAVALCWLALWQSWPSSIAAARPPRRVSLHYTRDEHAQTCIDSIRLARKVEAFTGPVLVAPSSAEAAVEVHVEAKTVGGFRARIQMAREGEAASGQRILEDDSPDCRSFDAALAFVIATTIDPDLVLERVGVLFDPDATPTKQELLDELTQRAAPNPQPLLTPKLVVAPVVRPASPRTRWQRTIGIGFAASNELPEPALGPALLARLRPWSWLELGAGLQAVFAVRPSELEPGSVHTRQFAGSLVLCPRLPLGQHGAVTLCLGPELAVLHAAGRGLDHSRSGSLWSGGALSRLDLTVRMSRSLFLGLAGFVRLSVPDRLVFELAGQRRTLFESPVAAPGGELSLRREF